MIVRFVKPIRIVLFSLAGCLVLGQVCSASAACLGPASDLSAGTTARFQVNPEAIFLDGQGGQTSTAELISKLRDLATADKTNLRPIVELLKVASAAQKSAIGTALAQAAQACATINAGYAGEIQAALGTAGDPSAISAFAAMTGDIPTGSIGAGSAAAGDGSSTGSSPASGSRSTGSTVSTGRVNNPQIPTFSFTGPTTGSTTTFVAGAATSVSP